MSFFTPELLAEAKRYREAASAGLVEVRHGDEWKPFVNIDRPLGEPWDRVVIHDDKVVAEHIGPQLYAIEYRLNGATQTWRDLLNLERTNPTKFTFHKMRIKE